MKSSKLLKASPPLTHEERLKLIYAPIKLRVFNTKNIHASKCKPEYWKLIGVCKE